MDEFGGSDGLDLGNVDDSLGDIDSMDSFDSVDSSIEDIEGSDSENIDDIEDMDEVSEIPEDIEELDFDEDIEDQELPDDIDPDDIEIVEEPEDIENLEIDDTDMTGDELENALEQEQLDEDLDELLGDISTDEIDVTNVEEESLDEETEQDIEEPDDLDYQEDIAEDEEVPEEEPLDEETEQDIEKPDDLDDQEDITEDEEVPEEEPLDEETEQDIEKPDDLDDQEDITEDEEVPEEEPLDEETEQDIEKPDDLDDQEDIIEDEEDNNFDDKEVNKPSWELSPEEKEDILSRQDDVSKKYREEHGLDEQGRSLEGNDKVNENNSEGGIERTHGEDGERTRYSDLQAELKTNHEINYEPMESSSGHSWELTPEEKELVLSNQAEVSETYRNKHNLDDHGDKIDYLKEDLDELVDDRDLQRLKDEVDYLDNNTSDMFENNEEESMTLDYSKEELQDIWDNDPGYVNEKAYRNLDEIDAGYKETGNHSEGLLNYGKDAVENTEKETMLPEGKILERYGSEQGRYLTEPGTQYEDLHLIVSEDKLPSQTYEVVKPFRVIESEIADQPFDEDIKENKENRAIQYKSSICVEDLIELGFLKRIGHE